LSQRKDKIKLYSFAGLIIGLAVGIALSFVTNLAPTLKIVITFVISFFTWWLGWLSGKIQVLLSKAPDQTTIEKNFSNICSLIETENAILNLKNISPSVHAVIGEYASKRACHLLDGQEVFIGEYLDLLESSLRQSDGKIFATSLLTPKTWLEDDNYKNYLNEQAEKIESSEVRITRVFICNKNEFEADQVALNELVKLHKDSNIALGFCDKDRLLDGLKDPSYYRDFVRFVNTNTSWVIDGSTPAANQRSEDKGRVISVTVEYRPEIVNKKYSDYEQRIRQYVFDKWHVRHAD